MSSGDEQFIKELNEWLGTEPAVRESRIKELSDTKVVSKTTLKQMLKGRYNASETLQINIRAQMTLLGSGNPPPELKTASG